MSAFTIAAEPPTEVSIGYYHFDYAWSGYEKMLMKLIERHQIRRVCDVGGGANPSLPIEYVRQVGCEYTLLDRSQAELDKSPSGYSKVHADICNPDLQVPQQFGMVFSKMVAEHVPDAKRFHENVHKLLAPGGIAFHFFPTLYALPFVINRIVPDALSAAMLAIIRPRNRVTAAKFPAFYDWCRGPTRNQICKFEALGYDVLEYNGCFGHGYFDRVPGFRILHRRFTKFLIDNPRAGWTSYAWVVLRKRAA